MRQAEAGAERVEEQQPDSTGDRTGMVVDMRMKVCKGDCTDNDCTCEHEDEFKKLDAAPCVHRFGYACRDLLIEHPQLIGKVLSRAKKFKSTPGGENLLTILRTLQQRNIHHMSYGYRERTLRRALRRSGATLEPVLD